MDLKKLRDNAQKVAENPAIFSDALAVLDVLIEKEELIADFDAKKRELDSNKAEIKQLHKEVTSINREIETARNQLDTINNGIKADVVKAKDEMLRVAEGAIESKMEGSNQALKALNGRVTAKQAEYDDLENKIEIAKASMRELKDKIPV